MGDGEGKKHPSARRTEGISRRQFAVRAALASAAVAYLPTNVLAVDQKNLALPQQPPAGTAKLSPEAQAEADARHQAILTRHGSKLSDAQKGDIRRLTGELQKTLETLRKTELENGDAPALYLKPLVEREKIPVLPQVASSKKK